MINILKHLELYQNSRWTFINNNGAIANFPADNNNGNSFEFKTKITGRIQNNGTVPLKYFNFWELLKCHSLIVKLISFWLGPQDAL